MGEAVPVSRPPPPFHAAATADALEDAAAALRAVRFPLTPGSEADLEEMLRREMAPAGSGWSVCTQVRDQAWRRRRGKPYGPRPSTPMASRYDMICWRDDWGTGAPLNVRVELKMHLTPSHYRQLDRYLAADLHRPLIAAGWHVTPSTAAQLRTLERDLTDPAVGRPTRFAFVQLDRGGSLS